MNTRQYSIILGILLFLCLAPMPYGYYQLIRLVATGSFIYWAYRANKEKEDTAVWIFIFLAFLFQPLFKISLGRALWNIVDVIVGIYLIRRGCKK